MPGPGGPDAGGGAGAVASAKPMSVGFEVEVERLEEGSVCFSVHGELDHATLPVLRERLEAPELPQPARIVLLDLSGCSFVDSSALAMIMQLDRDLQGLEGRLGICSPTEPVMRVLRMTELDRALEIHPDRAAALSAALGGAPAGSSG